MNFLNSNEFDENQENLTFFPIFFKKAIDNKNELIYIYVYN